MKKGGFSLPRELKELNNLRLRSAGPNSVGRSPFKTFLHGRRRHRRQKMLQRCEIWHSVIYPAPDGYDIKLTAADFVSASFSIARHVAKEKNRQMLRAIRVQSSVSFSQ
jgi:hypothetical protein